MASWGFASGMSAAPTQAGLVLGTIHAFVLVHLMDE
jgi:hypothetical protein